MDKFLNTPLTNLILESDKVSLEIFLKNYLPKKELDKVTPEDILMYARLCPRLDKETEKNENHIYMIKIIWLLIESMEKGMHHGIILLTLLPKEVLFDLLEKK